MRHCRDNKGRLVIGAFVIIVGILALLENLDIVHTSRLLQFWPVVFILLGLLKLSRARRPAAYLWGGTLIVVGTVWILQNTGFVHIRLREWWPVFLILGGFLILARGKSRRDRPGFDGDPQTSMENKTVANKDFLDTSAVMSGHRLKSDSKNFRGGNITAIMGGVELDLRQASIETEVALHVLAFCGGIEITVPEDWVVVSEAAPFLGGIEDRSMSAMNATKRLVIKGSVVMGGVEIKN